MNSLDAVRDIGSLAGLMPRSHVDPPRPSPSVESQYVVEFICFRRFAFARGVGG